MKKYILYTLLTLGLIITYSCNQTIKGEGKVTQKDTIMKSFNEIVLDGNFRAIFIQDSTNKLILEAPNNLIKNFKISQSSNKLTISENNETENENVYNVYIHSNHYSSITLKGNIVGEQSGVIREKELILNLYDNTKFLGDLLLSTFELNIKDNSKANFTGTVNTWDLEAEDNSEISAPNLICSRLNFDLFGISTAEVHVKKEISGVANDNSQLIYLGRPERDFKSKDMAVIKEK